MKKITLLVAVFAITFTNAQKVYDFTGSTNPGNWIAAGSGISVTPSAEGLIFEFGAGTPRIDITRAADPFDVSTGTHMVVTFINNNTEIGGYSGFFDKNDGVSGPNKTQFLGWQAGVTPASSPGSGVEATYVFKLESTNYNNDLGNNTLNDTDNLVNMEYVGIRFRNAALAALTGDSATNGNLILKKIEIVDAGILSKASYNFANDNIAGFDGTNTGTVSSGGTTLDFAGDNSGATPKIAQTFYSVDASSNQYIHVVVDANASNADQVKFQFVDAGSVVQTYGNKTLNIGSPTTIDVDLSGKTEWTGNITEWRLVFSNTGAANVDAGLMKISKIVFNNSSTLSVNDNDLVSFTMYPNPAKDVLYFKSIDRIKSVNIYDVTGKSVIKSNEIVDDQMDVSILRSGIYIVTLESDKGDRGTRKLVIK
ncbi:T9SS type A sorting domain-containing protein [Seonamhaeicola maritimus]|uniref:T9SS type A sorting domain-containing protein n=1 Tax=Seonamhaeicola maritimus TaxID=2591822 RepID=UPI0024956601|nr:T9SS type A sorting domain-containing protein [Seonamhaeicola maritimus]